MNSVTKICRYFSYHQKLSYAHGVGLTKLMYQTIGDKLREQRDKYPEHMALVSHLQNRVFTYEQLCDQAEHVAAALLKLGLKRFDRVGIYSPNNYEWVLIQFACSMADLILVNINPAYQTKELEFCLRKVNCKALVMASQFRKSNYVNMINQICPELATCSPGDLKSKNLPDMKTIIRIDDEQTPGMFNFSDLYDIAGSKDINAMREISSKIDPDSPTNIQFTSGTTGSPKGATLTHFNILNNGVFIGERQRLTDKDRICIPVPLYHCFGMVLGNLTALCAGSGMILPSDGFNAKHTLEAVTKYKCTALYGVPTMFIEYLKEYEQNKSIYDLSNLRTGIMAGTLCPKPLMEKVVNIFNMKEITICYGMTETSPVSFQTNYDDNYEDRCGTVGTIFPHIEAKIVDKETHQILPINKPGHLCIRGYSVMQKYFNDPQKTKETIDENQWLYTGDIATLDDRGYLKITGRIKDMIIRGGENVYPKEIEEFLMRMPGIVDVQVVGVPDEKFGEEIFALIKIKDSNFNAKKVYEYCHGQIAHYKIPKYVKIVDEYPLTVTGKYQKFKMVEALVKEMSGNQKNFDKYKIRKY